jgi:ABC-type transport system involved in multi-copper enzyme maturation permease subunit
VNPFGPLLRFELVRAARRQRLILSRVVYALVITGVVIATYAAASAGSGKRTQVQDLAVITEGLFYGLFAMQFALTVMFVTNWTADAFTSEKEGRTLSFLLATPLSDHEIVLGKLVSRLARVGLLLLAGVPILCVLQFFGGVEPMAVVVGYTALAVTALSLGSLSLLCSVYLRTARAAGQRAARVVGLYIVSLMLIGQGLREFPRIAMWPGGVFNVVDLVDLINTGNPFAVGHLLADTVRGGGRLGDAVGPAVLNYIIFHLLAATVFLIWATFRLRPVAAAQADGPPRQPTTGFRRSPPRPPVGDRPVLWKALHFDLRQYRSVGGRTIARLVFVVSFIPVIVLLAVMAYDGTSSELAVVMNFGFVRGVGTLILCGLLVMITVHTAGCIARERRKQTLDELLLTDLTTEEILAQKWWASIVVVRPALVLVGVHWLIAVAVGGLHPLAMPLLVVEWAAYAAFAASLGLYWATRLSLVRAVQVAGGLLIFGVVSVPITVGTLVAVVIGGRGGWFALPMALSPPFTLWASGFTASNVAQVRTGHFVIGPGIVGCIAGVIAAAALAWGLWRGACRRFPRS